MAQATPEHTGPALPERATHVRSGRKAFKSYSLCIHMKDKKLYCDYIVCPSFEYCINFVQV
jgi:hypothetical protein